MLDKTHIKFFTYKTFSRFLSDSGLKIKEFKPTLFDALGTQPNNPYQHLQYLIKFFIVKDPHSFVIKYVVKCSKFDYSDDNINSKNLSLIENYFIKNRESILKMSNKKIIFSKKQRFFYKIHDAYIILFNINLT